MAFAYRTIFLSLCTLAFAQASSQGDTATERILQGLKDVTSMCDNLRIDTENINIESGAEYGRIIALGITGITEKIGHGIEKMSTASPLPDADAKLVVQSLTKFVQAHEAFFGVLTAKKGIFTLKPFFESIAAALANLETDLSNFASKLNALVPTQKPAAEEKFHSLAIAVKQSQQAYSEESTSTVTDKIVQGIQTVTDMSNNLRVATQQITVFNAAQQGVVIAQGFAAIIAKIGEGITRVDSVTSGALPDADAVLVVQALTTFVQVHQALLNVVIGKHGIIALFPFFEPIRLALVSLEAVIDTLAFDLIALIPTQQPAAEQQFALLSVTLHDAQNTYSSINSHPTLKETTDSVTEKTLQGIHTVTQMSDNLRVATAKITVYNVAQQGYIIAEGFTAIIAKIGEGITRVDSVTSGPLPDADAVLIVEALTTFVQVHQALLNVVIGKHGVLALFGPLLEPIRLALVSLEVVIDTLAFDLIALIPTQQPAAEVQFGLLSVTLHDAQNTYTYGQTTALSTETVTERILQGIQTVTDMSDSLRVATQQITAFNAAQQGVVIAQGFAAIIAKIGEGITRVDSVTTGALPDADAVLVVQALTTFVQVHQALLSVVIGKHGIIALFPFFEPIRLALVSLEAVIDTLAFDLIALIPTQQPAAEQQFALLSVTLHDAQKLTASAIQL